MKKKDKKDRQQNWTAQSLSKVGGEVAAAGGEAAAAEATSANS